MKIGSFDIELIPGWKTLEEEGNDVTSIVRINDPQGALQLSSYIMPDNCQLNIFDELFDFTSNYISDKTEFKKVQETKNGLLLNGIIQDDRKWIFAICNKDNALVFATYNSRLEDFEVEKDDIITMINSINFSAPF